MLGVDAHFLASVGHGRHESILYEVAVGFCDFRILETDSMYSQYSNSFPWWMVNESMITWRFAARHSKQGTSSMFCSEGDRTPHTIRQKKSSLNSQKCAIIRSRTMWRRLKSIIAVHFLFVPSFLGGFLVIVLSSFSLVFLVSLFFVLHRPVLLVLLRGFSCHPFFSFVFLSSPSLLVSFCHFFFFVFASSFTPFSCLFFRVFLLL